MAQKSTVFKAELQVNDLDRQYYHTHALTLARHPSETDERMLVRLLAFALNADPALAFGNGLSTDDEPDLWLKDLTGLISLWIDVGLPEAKLLKKAAGRAQRVVVYAYGRNADRWWAENEAELARFDNLAVWRLAEDTTRALAALAQRNMQLNCMIQDEAVTFADGETLVDIERVQLKAFAGRSLGLAGR
jgi:uncharacterized protein YaeQ